MGIMGMIKGAKDKFHKFEEKKILVKEGRLSELKEDRSRLEKIHKVNEEIRSEEEKIRDMRFAGIKRVGEAMHQHLEGVKIKQENQSGPIVSNRNPFASTGPNMFSSPQGSLSLGGEPRGNGKAMGQDPKGNSGIGKLGKKRTKGL